MARRPRIANAFDANTMNGSRDTARIAGTLSTANTTSVTSTTTSAASSGVATPFATWPGLGESARHGEESADQLHRAVVTVLALVLLVAQHLEPGEQQDDTEHEEHPPE